MDTHRSKIASWLDQSAGSTLLGVCPNTRLVTTAAIRVSAELSAPIMFAATLNQVDQNIGYTGWTPVSLVEFVTEQCSQIGIDPLPVCLDHGGPKQKDEHAGLSFDDSLRVVRESIEACILAGYQLIHVDCSKRRHPNEIVDQLIDRTVDLIGFAHSTCKEHNLQAVDYEIGTDDLDGKVTDEADFEYFLSSTFERLRELRLPKPVFVVAQVGTSLENSSLDTRLTAQLVAVARRHGTTLKCHFADYTANPSVFPEIGVSGANVGPEFSAAQYDAIGLGTSIEAKLVVDEVSAAVVRSNLWKKWLLPDEGAEFDSLTRERQRFLLKNCSRYVWTSGAVARALQALFHRDPRYEDFVISHIMLAIERYVQAFGLAGLAR